MPYMCVFFFTLIVIFLASLANRHLKNFFGKFDLLKSFVMLLILLLLLLKCFLKNTSKNWLYCLNNNNNKRLTLIQRVYHVKVDISDNIQKSLLANLVLQLEQRQSQRSREYMLLGTQEELPLDTGLSSEFTVSCGKKGSILAH